LAKQQTSPSTRLGFNLDLTGFGKADSKDKNYQYGKSGSGSSPHGNEPAIQEKEVQVIFELPDGSQGEPQNFKLGQTVEVLKSYVEVEYGIPMQEQSLYLDDRKMENPFSLLDYPEAKGK
jgi:hypothetical protein